MKLRYYIKTILHNFIIIIIIDNQCSLMCVLQEIIMTTNLSKLIWMDGL
jgi:hypothetical protein